MGWKDWPSWVKGGVIGFGIIFVIWLIMLLLGVISIHGCEGEQCFGAAIFSYLWFFPIGPILLISSFIVGAIIWAISGRVINSEGRPFFKGWKIGFWISFIFVIVYWIFYALLINTFSEDLTFFWKDFFGDGIILSILVLLFGSILGLIIGFIVGRIKGK